MRTLFGEVQLERADPQAGARRNEARWRGSGRHWETPWDLFQELDDEFHFTLDPCATDQTAKVSRYFTEKQNGLLQSWKDERVFMNPPYGKELPSWTRKAKRASIEEGAMVVGLLPASTDSAWFHTDVWQIAEVRFMRGRVRFKVGKTWASPFQPTMIAIWKPMWLKPFDKPELLTLLRRG